MIELAGHERIVAVKDAKGNLAGSGRVIAETGLAYYAGDDGLTLPLLSIGGVGVVGTSTHFSGALTKQLIEAYLAGRTDEALRLHQQLLPIYTGIFRTQGVILVKAGLDLLGRSAGPVRLPMVPATEQEISRLRDDLAAAGLH
jgi:4-hydroxy-tetrahydrodipicolinate synthase